MLKLYKLTPTTKQYWETWEIAPRRHMVHWGELGSRGETKVVTTSLFSAFGIGGSGIQQEIDKARNEAFEEVPIEAHAILLIEYIVDGFGTEADLEKRHALEDRMNETLGWTGLGNCDGGSIGSGTMEVCCFVVDFAVAKSVIEADLAGTDFVDYSRIYEEGADGC